MSFGSIRVELDKVLWWFLPCNPEGLLE